ncbi:hypothetical protein AURDEDRAFT_126956 [Auricularia subglabra TFB-10046 SS5]|nr:hypothetical protein AURDEDRAFT_126956 [Auricularia subglabra TFB-10046 SS5]
MSLIDIDESPQAQEPVMHAEARALRDAMPSRLPSFASLLTNTHQPVPAAGSWSRTEFMRQILHLCEPPSADEPALEAIGTAFPRVNSDDARLWLLYMKDCSSRGIRPSDFIMDSFRTVSWYKTIRANNFGTQLVPELARLSSAARELDGDNPSGEHDPAPQHTPSPRAAASVLSTAAEPIPSTASDPIPSTAAEPIPSTAAQPTPSTAAQPIPSIPSTAAAAPIPSTTATPAVSTGESSAAPQPGPASARVHNLPVPAAQAPQICVGPASGSIALLQQQLCRSRGLVNLVLGTITIDTINLHQTRGPE